MKSTKFAFAVNQQNTFEKTHFGDAYKYLIYEYNIDTNTMSIVSEQMNQLKNLDESHGSSVKGNEVTKSLKNLGVSVLVSMQFGANIKKINKHFIPIVVYKENIEEAILAIKKYFKCIYEELDSHTSEFKVFKIKDGILK